MVKAKTAGCGILVYIVIAVVVFVGYILYDHYVLRYSRLPYEIDDCWFSMGMYNRGYYAVALKTQAWPDPPESLFDESSNLSSVDPWGSPFKFMEKDGSLYVYSIGPDKKDDGGKIEYDEEDKEDPFGPGDITCWLRSMTDPPPTKPPREE